MYTAYYEITTARWNLYRTADAEISTRDEIPCRERVDGEKGIGEYAEGNTRRESNEKLDVPPKDRWSPETSSVRYYVQLVVVRNHRTPPTRFTSN